MALVTCADCQKERSDLAPACPHCGRPNPVDYVPGAKASAPGSRRSGVFVALLVAAVLLYVMSIAGGNSDDSPPALASAVSPVDPSAASPAPEPGSQWTYSHDTDEMTGKPSHRATVRSENTVNFGFPYNGAQHGELELRRHPRFGRDAIFSIQRGQLLCPSYEGCSVTIRFDDGGPLTFSANPSGDHSTEHIFIDNYERFVSRLRTAKKVRISPKVYQEGSVVFTFNVDGFDLAKMAGAPEAPKGSP